MSGDEAALGCAGTPSLPSFPAFRPSYSVAPSRRGTPAAGGIQPRARCGRGGGSREETPVPQPGLPGSSGAGGAGGAPATQEAGEVRGEPRLDGRWGLTQRVNPSPPPFHLISFISSHSACSTCAGCCPRGGCPCSPLLLARAKWSSGKVRDLGDPIQIPPSPASAGICHHQRHRS